MKVRARTKAIQGLLAGTLALVGYFPDIDPLATGNPDPVVDALVDEVERGELEPDDRQGVLERLAFSSSRAIRARVAEAAGGLRGPETGTGLALLRRLAHDTTGEVRRAAARGLARLIENAPGPVRAAVESDWVMARSVDERVTLARALGMSTPDWLTDLAIGELTTDGHSRVRRAALGAVESQVERNPSVYVALAAARVGDPDRLVRKSARKALRRVEASAWVRALGSGPNELRESRRRYRRAMRGDMLAFARPRPAGPLA